MTASEPWAVVRPTPSDHVVAHVQDKLFRPRSVRDRACAPQSCFLTGIPNEQDGALRTRRGDQCADHRHVTSTAARVVIRGVVLVGEPLAWKARFLRHAPSRCAAREIHSFFNSGSDPNIPTTLYGCASSVVAAKSMRNRLLAPRSVD